MKQVTTIVALLTAILSFEPCLAQQNLWQEQGLVSPIIDANGSVTISLYAPEAENVAIYGDLLPEGVDKAPLERNDQGVWEYRSEPLASELYCYRFEVDGMRDVHDPSNVYMMRDVGSQMNYFIVPGQRGDLYAAQDVPHGSVSRVWAPMPDGRQRRMVIYTPAGYERGGRYPVLYLLHGMGGDEEAWLATGRAAEILDNLIAQGKAEPMIVVMTNGCMRHVAAPGYSHEGMWHPYMSGSMDGSFESSFPAIVEWVDKNYRTRARKSQRAIAGLSMGGFHSMQISKQYPEMFDYVGLFSAAIFRGQEGVDIYNNLEIKLEEQFAANPALYWIGIGREDFLYQENVDYRALLDSHAHPYTYFESEGGHTWRNWRVYLSEFVPLLFR